MPLQMLLVMPATNASSERSFSGLRRIKVYLRTRMTQKRLNDLMVMNIHKEKTAAEMVFQQSWEITFNMLVALVRLHSL